MDMFKTEKAIETGGIYCEILLGKTGSGKTLYQTMEFVLPHLLAGHEVWCCYWLNWNKPNYHYFAPGDFDAVKNLRNVVVVFDELAQTFEPRQWEQENSDMRRFFQLHRHRHVAIIGNTQDVSLVAKTVGIIAHKWYYIETYNGLISRAIDLFTGPRIKCNVSEMNFQQVKKMANGFELDGLIQKNEDIKNYNKAFSVEKILHRELEEYKVEKYHLYCPKCCMRAGEQITREKEKEIVKVSYNKKEGEKLELVNKNYCGFCKTELELRESGMYDTDYEPPVKIQNRKSVIMKKVLLEKWIPE